MRSPRPVPQADIDTVITELLYIQATANDRAGATIPEIVLSLRIRGVEMSHERAEDALWAAPAAAADRLDIERNGHPIWTPSDIYTHNHPGAAPC